MNNNQKRIKMILEYFIEEKRINKEKYDELYKENEINSIKVQEIEKKINDLKKNIDYSNDFFTPGMKNKDFNLLETDKLTKIKDEICEKIEDNKVIIQQIDEKIKKIENIEKVATALEDEEIKRISLKECIEKVEFCEQIAIVDPNRCKMELDNVKKCLCETQNKMFHVKH